MTRAEREKFAVDRHARPRCHAARLNRCRSADLRRRVMKYPHPERVALMREGEQGA